MISRLLLPLLLTSVFLTSCIKDEFEDGNEDHFVKATIDGQAFYADQADGEITKESDGSFGPRVYIFASQSQQSSIYFAFENEKVLGKFSWDTIWSIQSYPVEINVYTPDARGYRQMDVGEINVEGLGQNPLRFKATFKGRVAYSYYNSTLGETVYDTLYVENGVADVAF
jgi:hypothetical protein